MKQNHLTSSPGRLRELLDPDFMGRLDALDILSRKILRGKLQGERRSKQRGWSVEFADHRPYVVGDDMRFIDWNVYGRLEQLFLKLFLEEQDLTLHIAIDASGSMGFGDPPKDRFAKKLAAALTYIGLVNNNRVTLSAFADGVRMQLANMRGRNYLPKIAEFLLGTDAQGPSDFNKACRQLTTGQTTKGVIILISDFLLKEGSQDGLRRLIGNQSELYVLQLLSPQELSPNLSGDLKLVDVEDNDVSEVTLSGALLDYYRRNLTAYCNELKGFCTRRGATYALVNSGDSVENLVLTYLRKNGLLR